MRPLALLALALLLPAALPAEDTASIRRSVIRIVTTSQEPDYTAPWSPGTLSGGSGTGFLLSDGRLLTNAHVVSNARNITVEREGDSRPVPARVKFIAHDADLAMLEVSDPRFLQGLIPLEIGGIPPLESVVTVYGYPIGGQRLSITQGIVSRIDFQLYSHTSMDTHLAIQVDAAINPGNSGGPVLQNGKLIGVAFQGYSGDVAQNTGYMIPTPVITRFLDDVKDGSYDSYMDLATGTFPLLNPTHRRALGLSPDDDTGVLVTQPFAAGGAHGILQPGDIILAIDTHPVSSSGTIDLQGERVDMAEIVERKFKGDSITLDILRDSQKQTVSVPLNSPWPFRALALRYNVRPRFVVFGGLVFQPLDQNFINSRDISDTTLQWTHSNFVSKELYLQRPEPVILSSILPDPINTHLRPFALSIVEEVNGQKIRTLDDLAAAFKQDTPFHVIKLLDKARPVVLEQTQVQAARQRILQGYNVTREQSLADPLTDPESR